jgi:hypothetical protein
MPQSFNTSNYAIFALRCFVQNDDSRVESQRRQGFCAGVDIGVNIISIAKNKHDGPVFDVAIAWNTLDLLKTKIKRYRSPLDSSKTLGYDVVYADIGGLSGAHGLVESLALLDALSKALEPRCIVIKSLLFRARNKT